MGAGLPNGQRILAHDPQGIASPFGTIPDPDNGPRGTAFYSDPRAQGFFRVIDDRQVAPNLDQSFGRIRGTAPTGGAGDSAVPFSRLPFLVIVTRHPEMEIDRLERKQITWTDIDTVTTGGAQVAIHHRKSMTVHHDGIEITDIGTIAESQAAPGTALAPTSDLRCRPAVWEAFVSGVTPGDI